MTFLAIIGVIAIVAILFTGGGILGWILKGIETIFELLLDGNMNCLGCFVQTLFWLFIIALVICGLL